MIEQPGFATSHLSEASYPLSYEDVERNIEKYRKAYPYLAFNHDAPNSIERRQNMISSLSESVSPLEFKKREEQPTPYVHTQPDDETSSTKTVDDGINPFYIAEGGIPVALAGAYAAKRYFDSKKNK